MSDAGAPTVTLSIDELARLGAADTELFAQAFFPRTFRQSSPPFARDLWEPMDDPTKRLVSLMCFRGSSKTTRCRVFAAKRISYGISRTILLVGSSQADAIRSVQWIRSQIERNKPWADAFKLSPGKKWEETQIEIEHGIFGHTIWILGAGIGSSLRGINFDDYRPDLIVIDDPQTDEMAASQEQREKLENLVLGAVKNSLAPTTDEPNAKLVMAITPQHKEDISQRVLVDPEWECRVFPCWTKETMDLPVDQQVSSWESRYPSSELRDAKKNAVRRNKLSVFAREMECRLTTPESALFRPSWLRVREPGVEPPKGCFAVLGIDPVPPPSERQMAKGLEGKDYEAQYVWGRHGGDYYLLDWRRNRGHEPNWSVTTALELAFRWRVSRIVIDAVAYQRVLKWLLEQAMRQRGTYYVVDPVADGMKKYARISNVVAGLAAEGRLIVGVNDTPFIEQFEAYGPLYSGHDDDLDASALALQSLHNPMMDRIDALGEISNFNVEEIPFIRSCP